MILTFINNFEIFSFLKFIITFLFFCRCVLAAASKYFKTLFSSLFDDSRKSVYDVNISSYETVEAVISYIYTGKIKVPLLLFCLIKSIY